MVAARLKDPAGARFPLMRGRPPDAMVGGDGLEPPTLSV